MVIRPPRRAILSVDPPAPHKPALFQRALHVDIIGVGVGTHRQALRTVSFITILSLCIGNTA